MQRRSTARRSPRTRPVSRLPGFQKLRGLCCFPEVHELVVTGWPLTEVARRIQEEWDEYSHASRRALVSMLTRYRASLLPAELAQHRLPLVFQVAVEKVEDEIDELNELVRAYRLQMQRIEIDLQTEKNIRKLFSTMTQEVRVARELLSEIARLKMDLGFRERQLGKVDLEADARGNVAARYPGTEIGKTLADPGSRRRLASIAQHALSLLQRGIELDSDEDGTAAG